MNIYPAEIEAALLTHPKVADAAVFGIPHADWGEEIKAVVEPAAGVEAGDVLTGELLAHCRRALAKFKLPEVDRLHRPRCPATPTASSTSASSATRTGRAVPAPSERGVA